MKLIKPSFEIITPINGEQILKQIELAARTCYKSEHKIGSIIKCASCKCDNVSDCSKPIYISNHCIGKNPSDYPMGLPSHIELIFNKLMSNNHNAMLEFGGNITVKFICDRGVSHELVRHRIASFAQESTRYCNYGKAEHIQFIIPCWLGLEQGEYNTNDSSFLSMSDDAYDWCQTMLNLEFRYNSLIKINKWSPQQARSVLPNSLKTEINVSANIREWREIFKQRTSKAAHPQMRELMCSLLDEFKTKISILFDDINYE